MSLKRGAFVLHCDHALCGTTVDLDTEDFDEAKELANDHKNDNGWATIQRGTRYADYCDRH